jgi:hypothetical protein
VATQYDHTMKCPVCNGSALMVCDIHGVSTFTCDDPTCGFSGSTPSKNPQTGRVEPMVADFVPEFWAESESPIDDPNIVPGTRPD